MKSTILFLALFVSPLITTTQLSSRGCPYAEIMEAAELDPVARRAAAEAIFRQEDLHNVQDADDAEQMQGCARRCCRRMGNRLNRLVAALIARGVTIATIFSITRACH